jgi:hypothetical protein
MFYYSKDVDNGFRLVFVRMHNFFSYKLFLLPENIRNIAQYQR